MFIVTVIPLMILKMECMLYLLCTKSDTSDVTFYGF